MIEAMNFRREADGTVTVDRFPEEIAIAHELLDAADPRWMRVSEDRSSVAILGVPYVRMDQLTYAQDCSVYWRGVYG